MLRGGLSTAAIVHVFENRYNGRYYLYSVSSVWNKEKGRAQKITNEYLVSIGYDDISQRYEVLHSSY